jgi:hypothetical protein
MTDAKSAWKGLGAQLTNLGGKLGAHYEDQHKAADDQPKPQNEEPLKRLGKVAQDAVGAAGAAAKDDSVKQDVKQVGRSLLGALDVTVRQVSDEVRKTVDKNRKS